MSRRRTAANPYLPAETNPFGQQENPFVPMNENIEQGVAPTEPEGPRVVTAPNTPQTAKPRGEVVTVDASLDRMKVAVVCEGCGQRGLLRLGQVSDSTRCRCGSSRVELLEASRRTAMPVMRTSVPSEYLVTCPGVGLEPTEKLYSHYDKATRYFEEERVAACPACNHKVKVKRDGTVGSHQITEATFSSAYNKVKHLLNWEASRKTAAGGWDSSTMPANTGSRDFSVEQVKQQIGMMNILSVSGGRVGTLTASNRVVGVELPVSSGYRVRVFLANDDTYTVQRVLSRAGTDKVKGERSGIYAFDLGETVYEAGMYKNVAFGSRRVAQTEWFPSVPSSATEKDIAAAVLTLLDLGWSPTNADDLDFKANKILNAINSRPNSADAADLKQALDEGTYWADGGMPDKWVGWLGGEFAAWDWSEVPQSHSLYGSRSSQRPSRRRVAEKECTCWEGYERVPGTEPCEKGSCRKKTSRRLTASGWMQSQNPHHHYKPVVKNGYELNLFASDVDYRWTVDAMVVGDSSSLELFEQGIGTSLEDAKRQAEQSAQFFQG